MARLRRLWSGRPEDAEHRSSVLRAMRAQSMEFCELNVEYGYSYESAAVVPDGTRAPDPIDDIRIYRALDPARRAPAPRLDRRRAGQPPARSRTSCRRAASC